MKSKRVTVRINEKVLKRLETQAKLDNITMSEIVNASVELYISTFDNNDLTVLEKTYLMSSLTFQYLTLGADNFAKNQEQIIEETKDSMRASRKQ